LQRLARELDVDVETARAGLATLLRHRDFTANRGPERTHDHEVFEITVDWGDICSDQDLLPVR
jgi:hypothetical protein